MEVVVGCWLLLVGVVIAGCCWFLLVFGWVDGWLSMVKVAWILVVDGCCWIFVGSMVFVGSWLLVV